MPEVPPPKEAIPEKKVPVAVPKKPEAPPAKGIYPGVVGHAFLGAGLSTCVDVSSSFTDCMAWGKYVVTIAYL